MDLFLVTPGLLERWHTVSLSWDEEAAACPAHFTEAPCPVCVGQWRRATLWARVGRPAWPISIHPPCLTPRLHAHRCSCCCRVACTQFFRVLCSHGQASPSGPTATIQMRARCCVLGGSAGRRTTTWGSRFLTRGRVPFPCRAGCGAPCLSWVRMCPHPRPAPFPFAV